MCELERVRVARVGRKSYAAVLVAKLRDAWASRRALSMRSTQRRGQGRFLAAAAVVRALQSLEVV